MHPCGTSKVDINLSKEKEPSVDEFFEALRVEWWNSTPRFASVPERKMKILI